MPPVAAQGLPPGHAGSRARQLAWARGQSGTEEGLPMVAETRATRPSGRNVLEELDSRIPTNFYWYLAVLACVGGFLFGYDTANIGSALGFISLQLSRL